MTTTTVSGLKELNSLLQKLPANIERNLMRGAMRAGQKVLADATKSNLRSNGSVDTGELEKSVRVRFKRSSERFGWIRSFVIVGNKKAYYPHWVEYGTATYYTGNGRTVGGAYNIAPKTADSLFLGGSFAESVMHPGMRPKPFIRPAVDNNADNAINQVAEYLQKRIPAEMKKAGL